MLFLPLANIFLCSICKKALNLLVLLQGGVMATHDEETRKFFKHSSVICVLSPRYASNKLSIFKQQASFVQEFMVHFLCMGLTPNGYHCETYIGDMFSLTPRLDHWN
jgi:hypothetical protein